MSSIMIPFKQVLPILIGVLIAIVSFKLIFEFAALVVYTEKSALKVQDPFAKDFEILNRKIEDRRKLNIFNDEELERLLALRAELTDKNKLYFHQLRSEYFEKERAGGFQPTFSEVWNQYWVHICLTWCLLNLFCIWIGYYIRCRTKNTD